MKLDDSYIARRRFLGGMICGGAAALGTGVSLPVVCYVGNLREEPPPDFMWLEKADFQLEPGTSKLIQYGRIPVILIQAPGADEPLRVFLATCTHFDCTVSYDRKANDIVCACHDGHYTIDGKVFSGPPPRPLKHLFTERHGDRLLIALEKENLEKALAESDA